MTESLHPDSEALARWRAGLCDAPEAGRLAAHLAGCPACRRALAGWTAVAARSAPAPVALDAARRTALTAPAGPRPRHRLGLALAAGLAAVAVGAGLWRWDSAPPAPAQQMVRQQEGTPPPVYEDLEFYRWLAGQRQGAAPAPGVRPA